MRSLLALSSVILVSDSSRYLVITKVFPDEYHLHTLDQILPAIAGLNPNVDLKKIVIGLMDRLSSYSLRDANESEDPKKRKKAEEEATIRLLERLKLSPEESSEIRPETEATPATSEAAPSQHLNAPESDQPKDVVGEVDAAASPAPQDESSKPPDTAAPTTEDEKPAEEILPSDIKLYEIFYEQVVSLVQAWNLPIQDTTALLLSLANLALNIFPDRLGKLTVVLIYYSGRPDG